MASDIGGVGIAHHAVQQRAGGLLGVGVGMVGAADVHSSSAGLTLAASSCRCTSSALASMSRPVSTNVMALRNPPMLFSDTFSVGGGGSPTTPSIRTWSAPSSDSRMESTRSVTSGLA